MTDDCGLCGQRHICNACSEVSEAKREAIARDLCSDEPTLKLLYTTPGVHALHSCCCNHAHAHAGACDCRRDLRLQMSAASFQAHG